MRNPLASSSLYFLSMVLMLLLSVPLDSNAADPSASAAQDKTEKDARKRLEQTGAPPLLQQAQPPAAPDPSVPSAYEPRDQAVAKHDWGQHFQLGGPASNGLVLSLAAAEQPLVYGPPYYLYLGLKNEQPSRRVLDAMPACHSLARTDTLIFRIRSDTGTELVVPNVYGDTEDVHEHPALVVEANGTLTDVVSLTDLLGGSARLFDLYQGSKSLTVTAEVPALQLHSNAVTVQIAGR